MTQIPLRLAVLQAITAHLQTTDFSSFGLTTWNYPASATLLAVFRGRAIIGDDTPLPSVSILEAPRQIDGDYAGEDFTTAADDWVLLVQGWVADDIENPTDPAYILAAIVQQKLSDLVAVDRNTGLGLNPALYMLGGKFCIQSIKLAPPVVRPPLPNISAKAFFYLPLTIRFAVDIREPFVTAGT